jgi:RecB family exonuclease
MTTKVPADFIIQWSHSSLSSFETCPLKYWAEKIAKTTVFTSSPATQYGLDAHKAFELYLGDGTPLPFNMSQYQGFIGKVKLIAEKADNVLLEKQLAMDASGAASEWGTGTGRGIADVLLLFGEQAVIIDYKTGKYRGPTSQAVINAKLVMANYNVNMVHTRFCYLKEDKTEEQVFTRDTVDQSFAGVARLVAQLEAAVANENFPARKNGLCRQYCGHMGCPHNGGYVR